MGTFVRIILFSAAAARGVTSVPLNQYREPEHERSPVHLLCQPTEFTRAPIRFTFLWRTASVSAYSLPILSVPTDADWIATVNCDHGIDNRRVGGEIN